MLGNDDSKRDFYAKIAAIFLNEIFTDK